MTQRAIEQSLHNTTFRIPSDDTIFLESIRIGFQNQFPIPAMPIKLKCWLLFIKPHNTEIVHCLFNCYERIALARLIVDRLCGG